jgi:hypothetical protein
MTQLPPRDSDSGQPSLQLVEDELELALTFVEISSTAYSMGRLQHAADARSKAEAVRARAVAQLPESTAAGEDSIQVMLSEVQNALARLPSSSEFGRWVKRVAS